MVAAARSRVVRQAGRQAGSTVKSNSRKIIIIAGKQPVLFPSAVNKREEEPERRELWPLASKLLLAYRVISIIIISYNASPELVHVYR